MAMLRAFEMELGHFALDHTWVGAQATKWKTTVGNVPQEAGVELWQLRGGRHLIRLLCFVLVLLFPSIEISG